MSLDQWLEKAKKDGIINDKPSNKPQKEDKTEVKTVASGPTKKEPRDILPSGNYQSKGVGSFRPGGSMLKQFREMFPCVDEWLSGKGKGTQQMYGYQFLHFCREANILPEDFGKLSRTKDEMEKARDMAWDATRKVYQKSSAQAMSMIKAVKSFFRFYSKGYRLPFDSQKGGHHYLQIKSSEKREKFTWGTLENARELIFAIINEANSLKYRTIFTLALVTGMRRNAFESLQWKHLKLVINVDAKEVMVIKVTSEIDCKIESYGIDFFYVFVTGNALRLLRRYEKAYRGNRGDNDFVFYCHDAKNMRGDTITRAWNRTVLKAERKSIIPEGAYKQLWFHRLRALSKKFVRNSGITDDEFKEFLMGHVLRGAREAYSERDPLELAKEYLKVNFEPPIEYLKEQLRKAIEEKERIEAEPKEADFSVRETLEARIDEETQGQGWQVPRIETLVLPTETPKPQATVETVREEVHEKLERILKPAPKHCLRGKTFGVRDTDAYCHDVCLQQSPTEYRACQELRQEQPDLFA